MLVRAAHEGDARLVHRTALDLATDVLRASRDRSRDRHPRPLRHLQEIAEPLTQPRRRVRRKAA
jgi:hypothetical protein